MLDKPLDTLNRDDILSLIDNSVREDRVIEYKELLPGPRDEDRREFLADFSSLANTSGGHILFGVTTQNGVPVEAKGLAELNVDQAILRLENILRDGLDPRIAGIQIRDIEGFPDGPVIVCRVPRSWAAPHMVRLTSRFHGRNSAGKFALDVREIRAAFLLSERFADIARRFRADRLLQIKSDPPVTLLDGARTVVHLVPIGAGDDRSASFAHSWLHEARPLPIGGGVETFRYNFEGVLGYNEGWRYIQIFRDGSIESVEVTPGTYNGRQIISSFALERNVTKALASYLREYARRGIVSPVWLMMSLMNVKGLTMATSNTTVGEIIGRPDLLLPEVLIDDLATAPEHILKPVLDVLWQSSGCRESPFVRGNEQV